LKVCRVEHERKLRLKSEDEFIFFLNFLGIENGVECREAILSKWYAVVCSDFDVFFGEDFDCFVFEGVFVYNKSSSSYFVVIIWRWEIVDGKLCNLAACSSEIFFLNAYIRQKSEFDVAVIVGDDADI